MLNDRKLTKDQAARDREMHSLRLATRLESRGLQHNVNGSSAAVATSMLSMLSMLANLGSTLLRFLPEKEATPVENKPRRPFG